MTASYSEASARQRYEGLARGVAFSFIIIIVIIIIYLFYLFYFFFFFSFPLLFKQCRTFVNPYYADSFHMQVIQVGEISPQECPFEYRLHSDRASRQKPYQILVKN